MVESGINQGKLMSKIFAELAMSWNFGDRSAEAIAERYSHLFQERKKAIANREQALKAVEEDPMKKLEDRIKALEQQPISQEMIAQAIVGKPIAVLEVQQLEKELDEVTRERNNLKLQVKSMQEQMLDVQDIFETFTRMATVSQIVTLGDFKTRLQYVIDKWGNVVELQHQPMNDA